MTVEREKKKKCCALGGVGGEESGACVGEGECVRARGGGVVSTFAFADFFDKKKKNTRKKKKEEREKGKGTMIF